jgi:MHS family proline/betaine transporter-like MFS transporter
MLLMTPVSLFFAWLADIYGRKALLLLGAGLGVVGSLPFFWLMYHNDLSLIYLGQAGFVLSIGVQFGVMNALMTESTPEGIRCTALAVGNNIAWTLLGSATPLVATWLVYRTADQFSPAYLIMASSAITFAALLVTRDNFKYELGAPKAAPAE